MRLSQHSDFALRMLVQAALKAPDLTTVGEVAQSFGISVAHLQKVAQTLAHHGYLETVRGRAGGLRLAKLPEQIRVGQVISVTEPDFQIAPCMSPADAFCPIYEPCVLRSILVEASDAFLAELDKWTLADLIKPRKPMLVALSKSTT